MSIFRIKKDYTVFGEDFYWGEVAEEKMKTYLDLIEKEGFLAFKKKAYQDDRGFYDFIFSNVRADWRFCLPLNKDSKALDIGSGLGANTFVLAQEVGEVYSVERSLLRKKFLEIRKEKEGYKNVKIMSADALDLPFENESFDLIIANGLFEWLGVTDKFKSPYDAQKHFLKEAKRVLKPGGHLYIGIENRIAAIYFLGSGRDHSGLKRTSLMPRFFANFYTKLRTGNPYRTYTYSKYGYDKILKKENFEDINFYLVAPGYNFPKYIIPYNNLSGLKFLMRQVWGDQSFRKKLLKKIILFPFVARLWRLTFFSFAITCQKRKD